MLIPGRASALIDRQPSATVATASQNGFRRQAITTPIVAKRTNRFGGSGEG